MKYYIPAILWGFLTLYVSTIGGVNLPPSWLDYISPDKIGHLVFYAIFCILILIGHTKNRTLPLKREGVNMALVITIVFGIGMEWMQYTFFPGRYFEVPDMIANIIGSFTGLYLFKRFIHKNF